MGAFTSEKDPENRPSFHFNMPQPVFKKIVHPNTAKDRGDSTEVKMLISGRITVAI